MYASFEGRLWAQMNGDPTFLFYFSINYKIKLIYRKI